MCPVSAFAGFGFLACEQSAVGSSSDSRCVLAVSKPLARSVFVCSIFCRRSVLRFPLTIFVARPVCPLFVFFAGPCSRYPARKIPDAVSCSAPRSSVLVQPVEQARTTESGVGLVRDARSDSGVGLDFAPVGCGFGCIFVSMI